MQLIQGDLFKDFPTLRFVIPHGGGAAPYHWGRYRGLAQELKKPLLREAKTDLHPAMRLSPRDPQIGQWHINLGDAELGSMHVDAATFPASAASNSACGFHCPHPPNRPQRITSVSEARALSTSEFGQ